MQQQQFKEDIIDGQLEQQTTSCLEQADGLVVAVTNGNVTSSASEGVANLMSSSRSELRLRVDHATEERTSHLLKEQYTHAKLDNLR